MAVHFENRQPRIDRLDARLLRELFLKVGFAWLLENLPPPTQMVIYPPNSPVVRLGLAWFGGVVAGHGTRNAASSACIRHVVTIGGGGGRLTRTAVACRARPNKGAKFGSPRTARVGRKPSRKRISETVSWSAARGDPTITTIDRVKNWKDQQLGGHDEPPCGSIEVADADACPAGRMRSRCSA